MGSATISVDEFQALEQKVLQTVELIKKEREARAAAETMQHIVEAERSVFESERNMFEAERDAALVEIEELRAKLAASNSMRTELESLQRERDAVRQRVEKMLAQMDELL